MKAAWAEPASALKAGVVLLPDAGQAPDELLPLASAMAQAGCRVIVPTLIDGVVRVFGLTATSPTTTPTNREWIYRQLSTWAGISSATKFKRLWRLSIGWGQENDLPLSLAGAGDGGPIALYASTLDPQVKFTLVSGYFEQRDQLWQEPLDRNVRGSLREFGDAELATLVAPRTLLIEGPSTHRLEFGQIAGLVPEKFQARHWIESSTPFLRAALDAFLGGIPEPTTTSPGDLGFSQQRQLRQVKELQEHVQAILRASNRTRDQFFLLSNARFNTRRLSRRLVPN